jgi:hypothetical protein
MKNKTGKAKKAAAATVRAVKRAVRPRRAGRPRASGGVPDKKTFDALFAGNAKSTQTILNHYLPRP